MVHPHTIHPKAHDSNRGRWFCKQQPQRFVVRLPNRRLVLARIFSPTHLRSLPLERIRSSSNGWLFSSPRIQSLYVFGAMCLYERIAGGYQRNCLHSLLQPENSSSVSSQPFLSSSKHLGIWFLLYIWLMQALLEQMCSLILQVKSMTMVIT